MSPHPRELMSRTILRISLKYFFLTASLFCIYLGWTVSIRRDHIRAMAQLTEDGAILYDEFYEPIGPNVFWVWLGRLCRSDVRDDWSAPIIERFDKSSIVFTQGRYACQLEGNNATRMQLALLTNLIRLESIYVIDSKLSPNDIALLKSMRNLKQLSLSDRHLDDRAISELKNLTQIKWLFLDLPRVSPGAVNDLQKALKNCEVRH